MAAAEALKSKSKPIPVQQAQQKLNPITNMQKIQDSIKAERINQQLTQRELASKSGRSQGTITRIERHGWTSIWTLLKVVEALGKELILN